MQLKSSYKSNSTRNLYDYAEEVDFGRKNPSKIDMPTEQETTFASKEE